MKGKTLFHLVQDLNKPERHQLLNTCKKSGDKRHGELYKLIKNSPQNKEQFVDFQEKAAKKLFPKKSEKERDKVLRRFIDFCVKEIENQKLKNYLNSDLKTRNYLLAEVYNKPTTEDPLRKYIRKAKSIAEKEGDLWMYKGCVDREIRIKSRTQTKKDIEELKHLLLEKNNITQTSYHKNLSEVYNLLSGLYMDDARTEDELAGLMLMEDEIDALLRLSKGKPEAVEYKLAQSRFSFYDRMILNRRLVELDELLDATKTDKETLERLERRVRFLKVLVKFHYGSEAKEVLVELDRIKKINEKYEINDNLTAFYWVFIKLTIDGSGKNREKLLTKLPEDAFTGETSYFGEFLEAYGYFLDQDLSGATRLLNNLSYAPNFYIAMWSRLVEMVTHYEKSNIALCESLITRANRQMQTNAGKHFTCNSNATVLQAVSDALGARTPKHIREESGGDVTSLHAVLLDRLEEVVRT